MCPSELRQVSGAPTTGQPRFYPQCLTVGDALRTEAEAFIADGFESSHGAKIYHYMPYLVTLTTTSIQACLGVRPATETLFIEQYLDQPIEQAAPELDVPREQIVEIGNLASHNRHATLLLFMMTVVSLQHAGFRELVFCATRQVAGIIKQTGAPLRPIIEADGSRLGASLPQWGRYYDTRPVVMHLNLSAVVALIQESPLLRRHSAGYALAIDDLIAQFTLSGNREIA